MSTYKQPNDWSEVIQAQSYSNLKHEQEEKSLKVLNQKLYKAELEGQFKEKELKKNHEKELRELDSQIIREQIQAFNNYKEKSKAEKKNWQNQLSLEYNSEITQKELEKKKMNLENLQEDKTFLENARINMENQMMMRNSMRNEKMLSEQQFLLYKNRVRDEENRRKAAEVKIDQDLVMQNIEKINKRDRDKAEFLKKIEETSELKQKSYDPVKQDSLSRQYQKLEMITNWEKQAQRKDQEKALANLQQKLQKKQEIADGLKRQLEEKYHKTDLKVAEFNYEKQLLDENLKKYQNYVERNKDEAMRSKAEYSKFLESQRILKGLEKYSEKMMNEKEKTVNIDILKKIEEKRDVEFRGVPGIHPRVSPLKSSFERAHRNVASMPGEMLSSHRRQTSQESINPVVISPLPENNRLSSVASCNSEIYKHNPITNPIGANLPANLPHYRGRGIQSLHTGNIFKLY